MAFTELEPISNPTKFFLTCLNILFIYSSQQRGRAFCAVFADGHGLFLLLIVGFSRILSGRSWLLFPTVDPFGGAVRLVDWEPMLWAGAQSRGFPDLKRQPVNFELSAK